MDFSRQERLVLIVLGGLLIVALFILFQRISAPPPFSEGPVQSSQEIVVQIQGAVRNPGVYRVLTGTRLYELLDVAGGAAEEAALFDLNLASPLYDGQRVTVPGARQETSASFSNLDRMVSELGTGAVQPAGNGSLINVNLASAGELQALPGIGEVIASRIVACRQDRGPFTRPEDLLGVSGIGEKKLEGIRNLITF